MPPHALGDDMDVPFMSCVPRRVQLGTEAMAPPGALMLTPSAPSALKAEPQRLLTQVGRHLASMPTSSQAPSNDRDRGPMCAGANYTLSHCACICVI